MNQFNTRINDVDDKLRIELRSTDGPLLGVLVLSPLRLEVKRGRRVFEVDLVETIRAGEAIIVEHTSAVSPG